MKIVYPEGILQSKFPKILKKIYRIPRTNNGMQVIIFVGKPNSGKSYAALDMAMRLNPGFSVNDIVFSAADFVKNLIETKKKGRVILLDDASLVLLKRDAMTKQVKELVKVMHSFRFKNCITILTLPDLKSLENVALSVSDILIEMIKINRKEKTSSAKLKYISSDAITGQVYFKFPSEWVERPLANGMTLKIKIKRRRIEFSYPSEPLVSLYEKKKQEGLNRFYLKTHKVLGGIGGKKTSAVEEFQMQLKAAVSMKDKLLKNGKYELVKIMAFLNLPEAKANKVKRGLELFDEGEMPVW